MKVTLYAFRLTIARSLKIAVRARLSSQQIRITLPSGNMSLVYNSLNTNMSTVYSKVGAGVPDLVLFFACFIILWPKCCYLLFSLFVSMSHCCSLHAGNRMCSALVCRSCSSPPVLRECHCVNMQT